MFPPMRPSPTMPSFIAADSPGSSCEGDAAGPDARGPGGCAGRRRPGPASRWPKPKGWPGIGDLVRVVAGDLHAHDGAAGRPCAAGRWSAGSAGRSPRLVATRCRSRSATRAASSAARRRGRRGRRTPGGRGGRRAGAGRAGRPSGCSGTSAPPSASTSAVAALAAATSGWSKGWTPRAAPASATASSIVTARWPMPCGLASDPPTERRVAGRLRARRSGTCGRGRAGRRRRRRARRGARRRSARRRCRPCRATRPRAARSRGPSRRARGSRTKVTLSRPAAHAGGDGGGELERRVVARGRPSGPLWARASSPPWSSAATSTPMSSAGHDAEQRQRRVAAADVGPVLEHLREAALASERAELGAGVGDHREAARAPRRAPRPTRGGCASRWWSRTSTMRGAACVAGVALEPDPRDGGRVGGVEHVEPRTARRGQRACGPAPRGRGSSRPSPSRATCSMPVDQRVAPLGEGRAGRPAPRRSTGIHPSRSASSVGSSRQRVWSPAKSRAHRVAVDQVATDVARRRRRSRSRSAVSHRRRGHARVMRRRAAASAAAPGSRRPRRPCGRGRGTSPRRRRGPGPRHGRAWRGRRRRSGPCRCAGRSGSRPARRRRRRGRPGVSTCGTTAAMPGLVERARGGRRPAARRWPASVA